MTMQLPASATLAESHALLAQLGDGVDAVDAAALKNFDTSAIAFLLEAQRRAKASGKSFVVRNPPPKLVELAKLYGVDGLMSFEAT